MKKKVISMLLVLSMCFSLSVTAFAAEHDVDSDVNEALSHVYDEDYWESIYVTLDDGSVVEVGIHCDTTPADTAGTRSSLVPEVPVGTKNTYKVKITNAQLGGAVTVGALLSASAKQKLAAAAAAAINAQAVAAVVTTAKILAGIAAVNEIAGNTGFIVTAKVEYAAHFINSQGHNVYSWDLKSVKLGTY